MPTGTYRLAGGDEGFSCAPGPSGWRYVGSGPGGRLDLTVDGGGRQVRVELAAGGWLLRGGVSGADTVWVRSGAGSAPVERSAAASGFAGSSPGLLVAAVRLLRLSPGARARLRLVQVAGDGAGDPGGRAGLGAGRGDLARRRRPGRCRSPATGWPSWTPARSARCTWPAT